METLELKLHDGVTIVVPRNLESITTYVLLEQQTWFEKEIVFLRHWLTVIDIGDSGRMGTRLCRPRPLLGSCLGLVHLGLAPLRVGLEPLVSRLRLRTGPAPRPSSTFNGASE
jgi:hypothetical protein